MRSRFRNVREIVLVFIVTLAFGFWMFIGGTVQQAQVRSKFDDRASSRAPSADSLTARLRSKSYGLFRVPVGSDRDRERVASLGKIVADHGSFVVVSASTRLAESSLGDGAIKVETTVHLPGRRFDPIVSPPAETVAPGSLAPFGKGYYIVQFGTIATDELLTDLRNAGLEVLQYVPHNAFFVYGDPDAAGRAAEHARVRWVGSYTADAKLSEHVSDYMLEANGGVATFDVAVFKRADLGEVMNRVAKDTGASVIAAMDLQANFFDVLRIAAPVDQIGDIAAIGDVVRIDPYIRPTAEDERAAHIVAGNYTNSTTISGPGYNPLTQFGVDGTNVTIGMVDDGVSIPGDGGFYISSTNTVDGPLRGATAGAEGGHGHLNASIISGASPFGALDPTGHNYGLGVAPKSHIINIPFLKSGNTTTDQQAVDDTLNTLGPNGVKGTITNNSWGAGTNGNAYDSLAAQYDGFARDASIAGTIDPFLLIFSAGNSGASGLTRPKMAKNVIATGSSENLRTELSSGANNLDDMSSFSSRGLAADSRIKPDIVAPGQTISGSRAGTCGSVTSCFDTHHAWSSGTSHAAPQIAGVAALFTQWWKSVNAGANPNPAMTKAAILLTGQEMNGTGATNPVPNGDEGWGRVNMKFMLNTGVSMKHVDQATTLSAPGDGVVYTGIVADATKPFRVTLVWTDPPGVSDPSLVNNLDLTVQVGTSLYRGNVFSGGTSATGGGPDIRNNVEHVWLPAGTPAGTAVTITIGAAALNGDGALGNADTTDQHFALVAYNFTEAAPTTFSVSGRVTAGGRGVANAIVYLNSMSASYYALTNTFGYFRFQSVPNGTYTGSVDAKRYTFTPQVVNVSGSDLTGVNFVAVP